MRALLDRFRRWLAERDELRRRRAAVEHWRDPRVHGAYAAEFERRCQVDRVGALCGAALLLASIATLIGIVGRGWV